MAHLLVVAMLVRVVTDEDEAHVQANEWEEGVRDLLPLVRLGCRTSSLVTGKGQPNGRWPSVRAEAGQHGKLLE